MSIRRLLKSMSEEGIIGNFGDNADDDCEKDQDALEIYTAVKEYVRVLSFCARMVLEVNWASLESRINRLPPEDPHKDDWYSLVKSYLTFIPTERSKRAWPIAMDIQDVNNWTERTSQRRTKFKDLYNAAYRKMLPSPAPSISKGPVPRTAKYPTLSPVTTLGIGNQILLRTFPWLPSSNILDTIHTQELTLLSLSKRMVRIIEASYRQNAYKSNKETELVDEIAYLLQDTLKRSRRCPDVRMSLDRLVEQATSTIDLLQNLLTTPGTMSRSQRTMLYQQVAGDIESKKTTWRETLLLVRGLQVSIVQPTRPITDNQDWLMDTGLLPTMDSFDVAAFGKALAEEVWLWNASEEQIVTWENGKREIPSDWLCQNGLEVAATEFNLKNLSRQLTLNLKVRQLYDTPPRSDQKGVDIEGGFSRVERITLDEPLEHDYVVHDIFGIPRNVRWRTGEIAVKSVKKEGLQQITCLRIMREARAWSRMKHKNIIPLLGIWVNFVAGSPIPAFVSPWANQGTLSDHVRKNNHVLSISNRLGLMHGVASALAFMHNLEYPVVHGDLRGNNVLINDGRALLCDFGISHVLDGVNGTTTAMHGCWPWWAPEYFTFDETETGTRFKPTTQSDMYAYASVFFEAFTGRRPWSNCGMTTRVKNPAMLEPRPPEICEDYWKLLKCCWMEDPLLRLTANKVLEEMRVFMQNTGPDEID
ncbi:hypothetical protein M0805_008127 [Coniferiporia weirii]|nr:hypothetical protein M0805_008127 [Coniferiporia weirii]